MYGHIPDMSHFAHFARRVRERIGPHIDAEDLWLRIVIAMEDQRWDLLRFVGRTDRNTLRRIWMIRIGADGVFYVLFDHRRFQPITILLPGWTVTNKGQRQRLDDQID